MPHSVTGRPRNRAAMRNSVRLATLRGTKMFAPRSPGGSEDATLWAHLEGALMEFRITSTLVSVGATAELGDALLEQLLDVAVDAGPVVATNETHDTVDVTLVVERQDLFAAVERAGVLTGLAIGHLDLTAGRIVGLTCQAVEERDGEPEPVPA